MAIFQNNNQRRMQNSSGGQGLLLGVAVITSALFSFLYISNRFAATPGEGTVVTNPVVPPAGAATATLPATNSAETSGYEATDLVAEQILHAGAGPAGKTEKILARTPVVYETGVMRWSPEEVARAKELQTKLVAVLRHQAALDRELEKLDADWRALVQAGTPTGALRADSPSQPIAPRAE